MNTFVTFKWNTIDKFPTNLRRPVLMSYVYLDTKMNVGLKDVIFLNICHLKRL